MNKRLGFRNILGRGFLFYFAATSALGLYPWQRAAAQAGVLEQAQNAYYDAKFEDCINLLAPLTAAGDLGDLQLDSALQFLGAAYQQQGEVAKARETFRNLVIFDNNALIDEKFFPTDAVSLFQEARRDYLASLDKVGFFKISGEGSDALILMDGKRRRNSEELVKVTVGRHRLEFRKTGQTPFVREAEIKREGETVEIKIEDKDWRGAALALGSVVMVLEPLDALVEMDGKPVTLVEGKAELVPGKHTYRVSREGYADKTGGFEVKTGKSTKVEVKLKAGAGPTVSTAEKKSSSKKWLFIGGGAAVAAVLVAVVAGGGGGEKKPPVGPLPPPPPPPSKPSPAGRR